MKILIALLTVGLGVLQYKLWLGDDSRRELKEVEQNVALQFSTNAALSERNEALEVEGMR